MRRLDRACGLFACWIAGCASSQPALLSFEADAAASPDAGINEGATQGPGEFCPAAANTSVTYGNARSDLEYMMERWEQLKAVEDRGEQYWYMESNCDRLAGREQRTYVEVTGGKITRFERQQRDGCVGCLARDERFEPRTMEELLDDCSWLVRSQSTGTYLFVQGDETGAITYCAAHEPDCRGNCDQGFYLHGYGFGPLEDSFLSAP